MALIFNNVSPTEIFAVTDSSFSLSWPSGVKSTTWASNEAGSWYCSASFSSTYAYSYTHLCCNSILLSSSYQTIFTTSSSDLGGAEITTYTMYAQYSNGTLSLRQTTSITTTIQPSGATTNVVGTSYSTTFQGQTALTVLRQNTTNVWGKPYTLSVSKGANTSLVISRTSSPNQQAATGTLISYTTSAEMSSSVSTSIVVYYGDVLSFTSAASDGYDLTTFTVGGTTWTSGDSITVSSAIAVITVAEAQPVWNVVWTGTSTVSFNGPSTATTRTISNSGFSSNYSTRITFSIATANPAFSSGLSGTAVLSTSSSTIYAKTIGSIKPNQRDFGRITFTGYYTINSQLLTLLMTENVRDRTYTIGDIQYYSATFTLTKIEQYY